MGFGKQGAGSGERRSVALKRPGLHFYGLHLPLVLPLLQKSDAQDPFLSQACGNLGVWKKRPKHPAEIALCQCSEIALFRLKNPDFGTFGTFFNQFLLQPIVD